MTANFVVEKLGRGADEIPGDGDAAGEVLERLDRGLAPAERIVVQGQQTEIKALHEIDFLFGVVAHVGEGDRQFWFLAGYYTNLYLITLPRKPSP
jgi:hypothetical protein